MKKNMTIHFIKSVCSLLGNNRAILKLGISDFEIREEFIGISANRATKVMPWHKVFK